MSRSLTLPLHLLGGATLAALLNGCGGPPAEAANAEVGSVVVTQWNDSTELFLEYPHPVAGVATGNWAIHMTDRTDFQPIRSGELKVRFTGGGGEAQTFAIGAPARDGIFLIDPVITRPGTYRVEFLLESPQVNSQHVLDEVTVYASTEAAPPSGNEEGGGISFLKEQQWVIPFQAVRAREQEIRRTAEAPGEIVPPDGSLIQVSAPVDGIAEAAANRNAPSVGQRVRPGDVLAVLSPTAQEGGFAQIRARVERLEREVARAEGLYEVGAIARKRLEEARHDLAVARAEAEAMGASGSSEDFRLRLTTPIGGVIARRAFVPGGRVQAGEELFAVVDPGTAWLRVRVSAPVASSIPSNAHALFTPEGTEAVREASGLISIGKVLDPASRTLPVVFRIDRPDGLSFGQLARASVPIGGTATGVVLPNTAIVDDNGTPVAYVQVSGETFERRVLSLGASDGTSTLIRSGLLPGEMVVVTGAYQVRLASMSGGEFAGGHTH